MYSNLDTEIFELMDLLSFSLSKDFMEKWRFKYGERLVRLFQMRILESLKSSKNLKLDSLHKYLHKDSGFNSDLVKNFFIDIDYEIYSPIITGTMRSIEYE